jgi:hypothetical protein
MVLGGANPGGGMMTRYRVTPARNLRDEALMIGEFAAVVSVVIVLATGSSSASPVRRSDIAQLQPSVVDRIYRTRFPEPKGIYERSAAPPVIWTRSVLSQV